MSRDLTALGVDGLPEIHPGDDIAALIAARLPGAADGDTVVVTSKIVSKAEGALRTATRDEAVAGQTARVVALREQLQIVRTHHGLTLAAAGVDASNTKPGTVVLLPEDPDRSARHLRTELWRRTGRNVAVVLSDSAGRPWRLGQTDIAIGCAGLPPYRDYAGRTDDYGNPLEVTAPALADEIAGLGDLVMGKLGGCPVALVRGLADEVLAPGEDGPGAEALIRPDGDDLFALGAAEAVLAAVRRDDAAALAALAGRRRPVREVVELADGAELSIEQHGDDRAVVRGPDIVSAAAALERVCTIAVASGWAVAEDGRTDGRCRIVLRRSPRRP